MGIFDPVVRREIVGYRRGLGLQVKERTWRKDLGGALYNTDLWRNATYEEICNFEHKRSRETLFDLTTPTAPTVIDLYDPQTMMEFYSLYPSQKENKTMKINIKDRTDTIEIGKLAYGTYVTGITSHPSIVYQKIDKRNLGQGITLNFPSNHSLIMNVKLGSLRIVPGDTRVSVYEAELNLSRTTNFGPHLKDNIF